MSSIYAVDFDGTLCTNNYPAIGKENAAAVERVKEILAGGDEVVLWTCRAGELLTAAVEWCAERGITFTAVNENLQRNIDAFGGDTRKIYADFYIDDRAVSIEQFTQRGRKKR